MFAVCDMIVLYSSDEWEIVIVQKPTDNALFDIAYNSAILSAVDDIPAITYEFAS